MKMWVGRNVFFTSPAFIYFPADFDRSVYYMYQFFTIVLIRFYLTVNSEDVCWGIRNVKSLIKVLQHALFCDVCNRSLCIFAHEHASVRMKQYGLTWTCQHHVDMSTLVRARDCNYSIQIQTYVVVAGSWGWAPARVLSRKEIMCCSSFHTS